MINGDMPTSSPIVAPLGCVAAHGIAQRHGASSSVVAMLVAAVILGAVMLAVILGAARVSLAHPK